MQEGGRGGGGQVANEISLVCPSCIYVFHSLR